MNKANDSGSLNRVYYTGIFISRITPYTSLHFIHPILKAGLYGQLYLPAPCLPSTADKNGGAFTRPTCDLNKYSRVERSSVGGEFTVQRQYVSGC